jgi:S1-C subfamily serine protease
MFVRALAKALLVASGLLASPAALADADSPSGAASVVQLRAIGPDGTPRFGSGVVIGADQIATACHVTRNAASIEISQGSKHWVAREQVGSPPHDLCILHAPVSEVPIATIRDSRTLQTGERVVAAGFQGGRTPVAVKQGVVIALYPYDGGSVVRTSAPFDFGSSGGGLFDDAGNLVGLLSFKARAGENLRFALPSEWLSIDSAVAAASASIDSGSVVRAFWERPQQDRPEFLGLAMREAAREQK